jgi:hypothetical protein
VRVNDAPPVLATAAGRAGELYEKSLVALIDALGEADDVHWQAWMREDLAIWRAHEHTGHHRHAFGGMGSFNDRSPVDDPWVDASIAQLSHITAMTALRAQEDPNRFVQVSAIVTHGMQLHQRRCATCRREFVEEAGLARVAAAAWSSWAIPRMITDGLPVAREPYVRFVEEQTNGLERCAKFEAECSACGSAHWHHALMDIF